MLCRCDIIPGETWRSMSPPWAPPISKHSMCAAKLCTYVFADATSSGEAWITVLNPMGPTQLHIIVSSRQSMCASNRFAYVFAGATSSRGGMDAMGLTELHINKISRHWIECMQLTGLCVRRCDIIRGGMDQYLTPMGPTKLHVNPIFEIGPLEPRFSEWLVFEGV